jgi:predicted RND superfamily exporter protein
MGWQLGAMEAISMTLLVGLSVDYVFHMADAYTEAQNECSFSSPIGSKHVSAADH